MANLLLSARHLTIYHKDTVLVTSREGWISEGRAGLFHQDTRYLSTYHLTLSGLDPVFVGVSRPCYFAATFYYVNPDIGTAPHLIPANSLLLKVRRYVHEGVHEDIDLVNYAGKPVELSMVVSMEVDFADIFQVRGLAPVVPRIAESRWDPQTTTLFMRYRKKDFTRTVRYRCRDYTSPPRHTIGTIIFPLKLAPGEAWHTCAEIHLEDRAGPDHVAAHAMTGLTANLSEWQESAVQIEAAADVALAHSQAVLDLASLRLEEVGDQWYPAAGTPWYVAVFGRDALITSLQALTANLPFPLAALERLAQLQGRKVDRFTGEEPGRMPHERRHDELTTLGKLPYTPYYGTVDASLLYVILLHELYRFTADRGVLERFYPSAAACMEWAARYADLGGDGFVWYAPLSPSGYRNQGWKDAGDAVMYPDGSLVSPPIAIVEVQGYYYDALRRMAMIARLLGRDGEAEAYARRAEGLCARFNEVFWVESEGTYAYGLDPRRRPFATIVSNPGQLLWSGIVPPDRARQVAERLIRPDMFSGWGIRTLSATNPAYDPVAYQRGSVWPHDNGIIALGLKYYGYWQEANRVAEGIFATAACYENHSLPEVFVGTERGAESQPMPYAETNMPQAWASGSVFMLLRAILGLEPDPAQRRLVVRPSLPEWLPELTLRNLAVLGGQLDLHFQGTGAASTVHVLRREGDVEVDVRRGDAPCHPIRDGN